MTLAVTIHSIYDPAKKLSPEGRVKPGIVLDLPDAQFEELASRGAVREANEAETTIYEAQAAKKPKAAAKPKATAKPKAPATTDKKAADTGTDTGTDKTAADTSTTTDPDEMLG